MRYLLGLIVGLAALWLLLSGHYTPLLLSLGAASCAVVALLCWRMDIVDEETIPLHLLPRLPGYCLWLGAEIAKSNWAVAKLVAAPSMRLSPTMLTEDMRDKTELGQMIYANSITLTPGTITVALRGGIAEVHGLTNDTATDVEDGDMSRRVDALDRA